MQSMCTLEGCISSLYNDNVAIIYFDGWKKHLRTYGDIEDTSKIVAVILSIFGVEHSLVALLLSDTMIVIPSMIGVLKTPAAFIVLDVDNSPEYQRNLIEKLNIRYILTQPEFLSAKWLQCLQCSILHDDTLMTLGIVLLQLHKCHSKSWKMFEGIAYVITTSGTTGNPKIVKVPHSCIVPNILDFRTLFSLTSEDRVFNAAPLTFDPSIVEIFTCLSAGATLVTVPPSLKLIPHKLTQVLMDEGVTILQATPSLVCQCDVEILRKSILGENTKLKVLAFGGESCPDVSTLSSWKSKNNRTDMYNIYGITEVSSWATCHKINLDSDKVIPLGKALSKTSLMVIDTLSNRVTTRGEGKLFIGGPRCCFIDDELEPAEMRDTGDIVRILNDGTIIYVGRADDVIKLNGKRINLNDLQHVVTSAFPSINFATAIQHQKLIYLFVKAVIFSNTPTVESIKALLKNRLPAYYQPSFIHFIDIIPMTRHGKVDKKLILENFLSSNSVNDVKNIAETLAVCWKNIVGNNPQKEHQFLLEGGMSLQAIALAQQVETLTRYSFPLLVDTIINKKFADIVSYVNSCVQSQSSPKGHCSLMTAKKKRLDKSQGNTLSGFKVFGQGLVSQTSAKSLVNDSGFSCSPKEAIDEFTNTNVSQNKPIVEGDVKLLHHESVFEAIMVQRCSQICYLNGTCMSSYSRTNKKTALNQSLVSCLTLPNDVAIDEHDFNISIYLDLFWRFDTGKCVDASPLIISQGSNNMVFIGSHSKCFYALDLDTGYKLWETALGDRIESSATGSLCGKFVIVGCYDGSLYVLDVKNGQTYWKFTTGDAIKCSPVVDPSTGYVYVGSHDQHIYALDVNKTLCLWSVKTDGSIFSSPCISTDPTVLYACSLGGCIISVNTTSGDVNWSCNLGKPLFSSPALSNMGVVVGCVDGKLYHFSHSGNQLWCYLTDGHIFSSPCIYYKTGQETNSLKCYATFGSHDGHLHCVDLEEEVFVWKHRTSSFVYSSPFVQGLILHKPSNTVNNKATQKDRKMNSKATYSGHTCNVDAIVATCSTDGFIYFLSLLNGKLLSEIKLLGEVFSSPVIYDDKLVVGCRDNNIYCYQFHMPGD